MAPTEHSLTTTDRPYLSHPFLALVILNFVVFQLVNFSPAWTLNGGESIELEQGAHILQTNTAIMALVPGVFSLPIIQQPQDKSIFVANRLGQLTQFHLASQNGVTGLLAHNYLSGKDFYELDIGQEVRVLYADHHVGRYQVTSIHRFQKLQPKKLYSDFLDLETHERLTTSQVFDQFYRGEPHVTFQTCLEGDGRLDWGILFIIASPFSE